MKRLVLILVAAMMLCVGCGGKDSSEKEHSFDVAALSGELKSGIQFEDELNESRDAIFFKIYGISEDLVVKQSSYFSTNATTEEISVVECKDEDAAKEVKAAFDKRVESQKEVFKSYAPDEVSRLDKAVVKTIGKYAVLCVTADYDKANDIIDKY